MVKIETRCRIPIWWMFWRIQWHVILEPLITLQGAATWWIQCHDSRATCNIAGCKNSIRHIENGLSFLFFFNAVWALTSGGFRIVSDNTLCACLVISVTVVDIVDFNFWFSDLIKFAAILLQLCTTEEIVRQHCRHCHIRALTVVRWVFPLLFYLNTLGRHMARIQGLLLRKW